MGLLKKLKHFVKDSTKALVQLPKGVLKNPTRLITGVDPASTKLWNKITGSHNAALVNPYGGPTNAQLDKVGARGAARLGFKIADTVAGFYGGNAAGKALGTAGQSLAGSTSTLGRGAGNILTAAGDSIGTGGPDMDWGSIIKAGGSILGSVLGKKGSKKASKASAQAAEAAAREYYNALSGIQRDQAQYAQLASPAINALTQLNSGDYSGFNQSPDYLYARDEALKGVQGGAAAKGGLYSGNAGRRLAEVASGLASENLGNYRNSLFQTIGTGQHAADEVSGARLGAAGGIGNALMGAGDARASGIVGGTNAITGGIEDLAGLAGDYFGNSLLKKKKPAPIGAPYRGVTPDWSYDSIVRGG